MKPVETQSILMIQTSAQTELKARVTTAFTERSNYSTLLNYSRGYFGNLEDAEDALQEVFFYFWNAACEGHNLLPEDQEEAVKYLKTTLRNSFLKKIRKELETRTKELNEDLTIPSNTGQTGRVERYDVAMKKLVALVKKRVTLSPQQQKLWELMQELATVKEITETLGITEQNVYSQRNKLIAKIRQSITLKEIIEAE